MKRTNYKLLTTLVLTGVALIGSGCGNSGSSSKSGIAGYTGVPPITTPSASTSTTGVGIDLVLSSKAALDSYTGWTTNAPSATKVNVNLQKVATFAKAGGGYDYAMGGMITISFNDGTGKYVDTFSSNWQGGSQNMVGSNAENNKYNLLSSDYPGMSGNVGYHGFFEDTRVPRLMPPLYGQVILGGAVIVVIDSTNDTGDGTGPTSANGSVWFKNFYMRGPTLQNPYGGMGPHPSTDCWFISAGPYDCRSWVSGTGVNTKQNITPNNGYTQLGTFTGLDMKKAFNQ